MLLLSDQRSVSAQCKGDAVITAPGEAGHPSASKSTRSPDSPFSSKLSWSTRLLRSLGLAKTLDVSPGVHPAGGLVAGFRVPGGLLAGFRLPDGPWTGFRGSGGLMLGSLALACAACGGGSGDGQPGSGLAKTDSGTAISQPNDAAPLPLRPAHLASAREGEIVDRTKVLIRERASLRRTGNLSARTDFTVDGRAIAPEPALAIGLPWPGVSPAPTPIPTSQAGGTTATSAAGDRAATLPRSGTTVQEAGVEEDDLLKTDGKMLYGLQQMGWRNYQMETGRLRAYKRQTDGSVMATASLPLPGDPSTSTTMRGMVLVEDPARLALVGEANTWFPRLPDACLMPRPMPVSPGTISLPGDPCPPAGWSGVSPGAVYSAPKTTLQWVDVSGASPAAGARFVMDGHLIGIRQVGRYVYLALSYTPFLAADLLGSAATPAEIESRLAVLASDDILPRVQVDGGPSRRLVNETDCFLQQGNRSADLQLSVVVVFDAASPQGSWQGKCFFGGTQAIYMAPESLYLATSRDEVGVVAGQALFTAQTRTDIHKFRINAGQVSYQGSGDVAGHLGWDRDRAPYRMSEYAGDLRVMTFTGSLGWLSPADIGNPRKAPSPATLTVLRENTLTGSLEQVAVLPNPKRPESLGLPGEQIYAVRFQGERAYLVTFRQTDPLYVLDLSSPADPKTAGELKIPGYSDYLFPLPNSLLLGVGRDASLQGVVGGVKVALFDVRAAASPKEVTSLTFGDRYSNSGLEFSSRGINILKLPAPDTGPSAVPSAMEPASLVRIALPLSLPHPSLPNSGVDPSVPRPTFIWPGCYAQGLQLLEVDTRASTLRKHRWVASQPVDCSPELASDRSVQIDRQVYYWTRGDLRAETW